MTLCHYGCVLLLMLCAAHRPDRSQSRLSPGGRGRPSRRTGRREGVEVRISQSHSSSAEPPHHVLRVHGLLTGLVNRLPLLSEAQDNFHLTVLHEILQAYLQVLRRLLLNLICRRLRLRHLPEIFFSIS